jgi:hypothetical protein
MPRKTPPGGSVRISEESLKILRSIARKSGLEQKEIMGILLEMCQQHDLLNPDWQERLNAALKKGMWQLERKRHLENKERCAGLRGADQKWKCIQGRINKTPMIRILSENHEDALNLCEGCTETLDPVLENIEHKKTIAKLENRLKARSDQKFKAPICNRGAILTNDGLEFKTCPARSYDKPVDIKTWCKVFNRDTPCYSYAEIVIGVAEGKETDLKKNL